MAELSPALIKKELGEFVPDQAQKLLALAGIRDEEVFPVPAVLRKKPTLIGYYRLLMGVSQKQFYTSAAGLSQFKSMEHRGVISGKAEEGIAELCQEMCNYLAALIDQISPRITEQDVDQLPLL